MQGCNLPDFRASLSAVSNWVNILDHVVITTVVYPGSAKINYFTLNSMKLEIIGGLCLKSQELCQSSA